MFNGLGKMEGDYTIQLQAGAGALSLNTSRRVPLAVLENVKTQLMEMEKDGILTK